MAPVFIFVKDVENVLRQGKSEIEVPEGTRISAAASDLIRDRQIKIVYESSKATPAQEAPSTARPQPEKAVKGQKDVREVPSPEPGGRDSTSRAGLEISDDELQNVVDRVIKRFRQIKGEGPLIPAEGGEAPEEDDDLIICRCEEVTRGEIKEAIRTGMRTLNGVKRITRAGMGLCQGQTCQRLVSQILAEELGIPQVEVEPTTARAPVRPVLFSVFASG